MAKVLKGAEVAAAINAEIEEGVERLKAAGTVPCLAILRAGDSPDDVSYERAALKKAEKLGLDARSVVLSENVETATVVRSIEALNEDESVHGVLILRPLPPQVDETAVRNALDPAKDADGLTDVSISGVFTGNGEGFAPCTAQSCMEILEHYGVELDGKRALVIGRSLVVGRSVAMMLLARNATVQIAHTHTSNTPHLAQKSDIIIACAGRAQMVDASYLRPGQTLIDVGINFTDEGKMVGDVDFDAAQSIVDALTPVPGGVGSVTTSVLCKHVVQAACKAAGLR